MSGNRAITLTLSVRDADAVKRELQQIGPAGEQALQRIEAAAQRAQGRAGGGGMVGFQQAVGQAGFQIQDFAVQVQGGTNALTALSQQGSQLLGVFGPGGAIAGAILTVGLLTTQILMGGETAEQANKKAEDSFKALQQVAEDVAKVIREINDLFLTAAERGASAANAQRGALIETTRRLYDVTLQRNEANASELPGAERELAQQEARAAAMLNQRIQSTEGRLAAAQGRLAQFLAPFERQTETELFPARARVAGLREDMSRQGGRLGDLGETLRRAENSGVVGPEQYGPPNPDTPEARAAARRAAAAGAAAGRRDAAAARQLDARDLAAEERGNADALRDYEAALRAVETPLERYHRQIVDLAELQGRLREAGQPMSSEDQDRIIAGYDEQLSRAEAATNRTSGAMRELGQTFNSAFEDAIVKGKALSEVLQGVAEDLARIILRQSVVNPLANAASGALNSAGGFFSNLFSSGASAPVVASALGNAFMGGRLHPFATGGVVDRATVLPMALMGEAGPEAVMPLDRDSSGRLGVRAKGGGGSSITQNISIDARGADPSVVPLIRAAMNQAKNAAKAELIAEIERGGRASKAVGRRR
jgi:hypothetical protein